MMHILIDFKILCEIITLIESNKLQMHKVTPEQTKMQELKYQD